MLDKLKDRILEISNNTIIQKALSEFIFVMEYKFENKNIKTRCACNKLINTVEIYYNVYTNKFLCLGKGCDRYIKEQITEFNNIQRINKENKTEIYKLTSNYQIIKYDDLINNFNEFFRDRQQCVDCNKFILKSTFKIRCFDCYKIKNQMKCIDCNCDIPYSRHKKRCLKCYKINNPWF